MKAKERGVFVMLTDIRNKHLIPQEWKPYIDEYQEQLEDQEISIIFKMESPIKEKDIKEWLKGAVVPYAHTIQFSKKGKK